MQKITPFLWFNNNAEGAVKFYTSIFKNSKIKEITRYDDKTAKHVGRPKGSVMTVGFKLQGQDFVAINGGPVFKFTEAISMVVNCKTQKEIDYYWKKLSSNGGREVECGWVKDKYGLSWQITPAIQYKLLKKNTKGVMAAVMKMKKLDLKTLKNAAKNAK